MLCQITAGWLVGRVRGTLGPCFIQITTGWLVGKVREGQLVLNLYPSLNHKFGISRTQSTDKAKFSQTQNSTLTHTNIIS